MVRAARSRSRTRSHGRHYRRVTPKSKRPLIRHESVAALAKKDKAAKKRKEQQHRRKQVKQAEHVEMDRRKNERAKINEPTTTKSADFSGLRYSAQSGILEGLLLGIVFAIIFYILFLIFPVGLNWVIQLMK